MAINPIFFIGFFAGIAQTLAILYGYKCVKRALREHQDRKTWEHVKNAL